MNLRRMSLALALGLSLLPPTRALAATVVVNGFNVNGWGSWDTRDTSGVNLRGTNNSLPGNTGTYTTGDDATIAAQIQFLAEGQVSNDAAGGTPPAAPSGSLGGLGYVPPRRHFVEQRQVGYQLL